MNITAKYINRYTLNESMIKDKKTGEYFAISKIIGNDVQLSITIPKTDWRFFLCGERAKIISIRDDMIVRKIGSVGNGKQRNMTIPASDQDIFKLGEKVRLFPVNGVSESQLKQQTKDEQDGKIHTKKQMPKMH